MKKRFEFTDADKNLIKEAVQSLESETSGEMVVYFARNSDPYLESCWKLSALLGFMTLALFAALSWTWMLPEYITLFDTVLIVAATMVIGYVLPYFVPSLRLNFISKPTVHHRVMTKARDMFLQEQVFDTIDRTGILIYISELERTVQVLGDSGINQKIKHSDWNDAVGMVVGGIKTNQIASGISQAILRCKALLLEHNFIVREDDTNELSDDIRIED
jgi:putative membrane protein